MKRLTLVLALCIMSGPAFATCKSEAADKKLAGAALKSFMTKCERDAATTCEADSKEKKLAGAAKTSHMKKCVGDAVGIYTTPIAHADSVARARGITRAGHSQRCSMH